ncbi:MAG: methyltransferase [Verrucomicrobia bacterium]|nr:methyltransferase [Verrucomicrobiota bacterium]
MKSGGKNPSKELYNALRRLPWEQLWGEEVARFNRATAQERISRVAVIRAVGVVFSESGPEEQRPEVQQWLVGLLQDPAEKIRRYAMTALPKIGVEKSGEAELLALLNTTTAERETKFLGRTLDKIGGVATLKALERGLLPQTEQKVKASLARAQSPSTVRMDGVLADFAGLRIHLRGRKGLEQIVKQEVEANPTTRRKFRVVEIGSGLVVLQPIASFCLGDIYALRCFGTVGFVLGTVHATQSVESIACVIASPLSHRIFKIFTEGVIRYRLNFVAKGHQRGAVRAIANRAYTLCPEILNDARNAPWSVEIHPTGRGNSVELSPRLSPDPRFSYRQADVPAASHPPLAACMARLAGKREGEIVWDPFCGSGLELVERALLGGVRSVLGTDLSPEAIGISKRNFAAANLSVATAQFNCCDFRDAVDDLGLNSVTLIVTNPPMGRRVPIADLRGLIADLFDVAAKTLKPGGRLVFANPLPVGGCPAALKLESRQVVDFGGFNSRLEFYRKLPR